MGVHEFGLVMPADHELHASEQRGEDEIAVIEERFNIGGHRDVGELAGDPFRGEGERGTLREWRALQDEASLEAFGELRWRLGDHTRIHELELELLMSQSVPLDSLDSAAGGFGGHFVHILRFDVRETLERGEKVEHTHGVSLFCHKQIFFEGGEKGDNFR